MQAASPSHYQLLGVAADASPQDLRLAYRRAAARHHPDRAGSDVQSQDRMARINEAYAVLSHPQRRASYDQWLRARAARVQAEQAARAARPSRFSASWPWGLVAATTVFAIAALGTVLFKAGLPAAARAPVHAAGSSR